jgi:hypothetical protein
MKRTLMEYDSPYSIACMWSFLMIPTSTLLVIYLRDIPGALQIVNNTFITAAWHGGSELTSDAPGDGIYCRDLLCELWTNSLTGADMALELMFIPRQNEIGLCTSLTWEWILFIVCCCMPRCRPNKGAVVIVRGYEKELYMWGENWGQWVNGKFHFNEIDFQICVRVI